MSTMRCCSTWNFGDRLAELLALLGVIERRLVQNLEARRTASAQSAAIAFVDNLLDQRQALVLRRPAAHRRRPRRSRNRLR
jgi:hypothetical protein